MAKAKATPAPPPPLAQQLIEYYQANLRDACGPDNVPCISLICQKAVVKLHETQGGLFCRMRNPSTGSGKVYSVFEIETILDRGWCDSHVLCIKEVDRNAQ